MLKYNFVFSFANQQVNKLVAKTLPQMDIEEQYKYAQLSKRSDGTWFIEWSNKNPQTGKLERIRKTFDINRIKDVAEREIIGRKIADNLNLQLEKGYNFFEGNYKNEAENNGHRLGALLLRSFEILSANVKDESKKTYASVYSKFLKWIIDNDLAGMQVSEFSPETANDYIKTRAWLSPSAFNNDVVLLKKCFDIFAHTFKATTINPFKDVQQKKVVETNRFEILTPTELKNISDHLRNTDLKFFAFTQFILFEFFRPKHIGFLRRDSFDLENNVVTNFGTNTKTGRSVSKQLVKPMKETMLSLKFNELPPNFYLFGLDFKPSIKKHPSIKDAAGYQWREMCKVLDIDKRMYALRHTGAQMYLNNNENPDASWLQQMMEHKTLAETQTYIAKRKIKQVDQSKTLWPDY